MESVNSYSPDLFVDVDEVLVTTGRCFEYNQHQTLIHLPFMEIGASLPGCRSYTSPVLLSVT